MSTIAVHAPSRHRPQSARAGDTSRAIESVLVSGGQWDALVSGFDGVAADQLFAYASARWPNLRLDPVVFRKDGLVVGGVLMMVRRFPLGLGGIAVSKWGPMLEDNRREDAATLYSDMVEALVAEYGGRQGMLVSILPRPLFGAAEAELAALSACGFSPGEAMAAPDRYLVKLGLSATEQRRSLGQKWRYHLNKSEKGGLSFEPAGPERLGDFDQLYRAMTERKRFADHSAYDTLPALMGMREASLRPRLFFARHGGDVVAGAVVFAAGDVATYLYGATNGEALPLNAGYFLHWHIIDWLGRNGSARWYDLGGTEGFKGLHQFKKGMVGDAGVIAAIPPTMNYAGGWRARIFGHGALLARRTLVAARRRIEQGFSPSAAKGEAGADR